MSDDRICERIAPNRGGQPGKFCWFCGRPLVTWSMADGFDPKSGRPRFDVRKDCPRAVLHPHFIGEAP